MNYCQADDELFSSDLQVYVRAVNNPNTIFFVIFVSLSPRVMKFSENNLRDSQYFYMLEVKNSKLKCRTTFVAQLGSICFFDICFQIL